MYLVREEGSPSKSRLVERGHAGISLTEMVLVQTPEAWLVLKSAVVTPDSIKAVPGLTGLSNRALDLMYGDAHIIANNRFALAPGNIRYKFS